MNWGNHLHGQVSPAKSPGPGASRSIHLPSRHYCQRGRCHIPGIRERREHNRDFPTKPSYFRCDSVAICRDRTRQSQKLLSQPPRPTPALTRPDACLLPWAMLPRSRDSRFAASSSPSSRPAASSGASQRPGRSQHPRAPPPPPSLCRAVREGGKPLFWARMLRGRDTENSSAADGATLRQCRSRLVTAPAARWVLTLPAGATGTATPRPPARPPRDTPGLLPLALRWALGRDTPNCARRDARQRLSRLFFPSWRNCEEKRPCPGAGFVPNLQVQVSSACGWMEPKGLIMGGVNDR